MYKALVGLAAAVLCLVAILPWHLVAAGDRPALTSDVQAANSYTLTAQTAIWPANGYPGVPASRPLRVTTQQWYASPYRWRMDARLVGPPPQPAALVRWFVWEPTVTLRNGSRYWTYDAYDDTADVRRVPAHKLLSSGKSPLSFAEQASPLAAMSSLAGATDLQSLLQRASDCDSPVPFTKPVSAGTGTVAGRAAYIIDFGPRPCGWNSASSGEFMGRRVVWVDEQSFFVLKVLLYSVYRPSQVFERFQVTRIRFNQPINRAVFAISPPAGARRAPSNPSSGSSPVAKPLRVIRRQVSFPIFVPTWLPDGLHPVESTVSRAQIVQITYRALHPSLSILEGPLGCCLDGDPRKYSNPLRLSSADTAYLLDVGKQFGGLILWWDTAHSYVSLESPSLTEAQLVRVAKSMTSRSRG